MYKILILVLTIFLFQNSSFSYVENESLNSNSNDGCYTDYPDYYDDGYDGNQSIFTRLKNALLGQPTGMTPQVYYPSSYLNQYGPSYMRGYYGNNRWNMHNSYNPVYSGANIKMLD